MKKYLYILAGVAFFSLLTSSSAFAVDSYPSLTESHYMLESVDGFSRDSSARGSTGINYSCKYNRLGEINFFPKTPYDDGQGGYNLSASACSYAVVNDRLVEPAIDGASGRIGYTFNQNGRSTSSTGVWNNAILNSLTRPSIYHASSYVSAFSSFTPGYQYGNPSNSFTMPIGDEDGYAFYIITLTNLSGYNTTAVAPLLYNYNNYLNVVVDSGNITREDIVSVINGSATAGWVWTDSDGNKRSTLNYCDSADSNCIRIIPEGEQFDAIENYLKVLEDGTMFAIYAFPVYDDAGYHITDLSFTTPSSMADYGTTFEKLNGNEEGYWGMPFVYSMPYSSYQSLDGQFNVLYQDSYAISISTLFLMPTTPEAFARSRLFAGQLVSSHGNSLRYQNNLSLIEPNPGNNMWGNIFNLGNLIFPFQSFLSGFTNQQCVDIPIIGAWLGLGANQQYCSWWSADIRNVLTPIFAASSMMLLFGFIVHWLRKDAGTIRIKEDA